MAEKLETLFIELRADQKKLRKELKALRKNTDKEAKSIGKSFGSMLGKGFVAAGGFFALVSVLKKGFTALRAFDKGMRNVNTIIKVSEKQLKKYTKAVRDLSSRTGASTKELTDGFYQLVSAGVAAGDSMAFLETATKAATAGLSDTKTAIDGMTTIMNAWQMSAKDANKIFDTLFKTVELGKTTFGEIAASISMVAPLAAAVGVSFEQVSGAVAHLTAQGTPTSVAMTQIASAINGMNTELGDGWTRTRTLQEAMEEMFKKAGGSAEKLLKMMGRKEGMLAVLASAGKNAEAAGKKFKLMGEAAGAGMAAFNEQTKAIDFKINKLSIEWENFLEQSTTGVVTLATNIIGISDMIYTSFSALFTWIIDRWNTVARTIDSVLPDWLTGGGGINPLPPGSLDFGKEPNFDFMNKNNLPGGISVTPKAPEVPEAKDIVGSSLAGMEAAGFDFEVFNPDIWLDFIDQDVKPAMIDASDDFNDNMISGANSFGALLTSTLGLAADSFVGILTDGISIVAQLLGIASSFTPGGSFLKLLFGQKGGTFEGGKKVASFAGGGDFMVPGTGTSDSFPMMVAPGERVTVTPSSRVGEESKILGKVLGAIQAMNMNLINLDNSVTVVNNADIQSTVLKNKSEENTLNKAGVNFDGL